MYVKDRRDMDGNKDLSGLKPSLMVVSEYTSVLAQFNASCYKTRIIIFKKQSKQKFEEQTFMKTLYTSSANNHLI